MSASKASWIRHVRLFPQTIFWRLTWLMILVLVICQAFVLVSVAQSRLKMVASQVSDEAIEVLAQLETQLDGLSRAERIAYLAEYNVPYNTQLLPINDLRAPSPQEIPSDFLTRALAKKLRESLAQVKEIRVQNEPKYALWLQVGMLDETYWLVIPLGRLKANPTWPIIFSAITFTIAALVAAGLFAWKINRPLRRLTQAAAALGRGEQPEPLPEHGPLEVKGLSQSFNRMIADLETNERERATMLAGISHDLRTPLARLKLAVEMMQDDSLRPGMAEDVEDIERILGQFIDFARGGAGESPRPCDLNQLLGELAERYRRSGQYLELELAPDLPLLDVRPLAINRLLSNLIENARRYGAAPFCLQTRLLQGGVELRVSDHGPGIAADAIDEALKPFHRLDSARRADGGSGLGLAIVDRIVRLHRGELHLQNRSEGGLEVVIRLPL
ncbi:ATP-binding protein [Parachitinimonas caeni]|uniref:histidine kinase n=1 Tax=Parachitinimonas caeni TaxID=3031301 RepID=A0ABT7DW37_9NEIS|nr:ATP-binding protein [Parachitinimonas caeni]MDK2124059.1 ATP-binding protein [Parachitinimonas caeni]